MALIPPQPLGVLPGSGYWNDWIEKVRTLLNNLTSNGVTSSGSLTANRIILGNGLQEVKTLGSLGTTTTVLHGNAAGVPSFGPIVLTTDVSGTLPVANGGTGITSFGTGVATWLGTPSSANLAAALTDETGTGAAVFANTPTLVSPVIGAATGTSLVLSAGITTGNTTLHTTTTNLTNGAGSGLGTLTNAPTAGDPTKWVPINDNGTTRYIPAW